MELALVVEESFNHYFAGQVYERESALAWILENAAWNLDMDVKDVRQHYERGKKLMAKK